MSADSHIRNRDEGSDISLPARLEAILYLKGRPVSLKEMMELSNESKPDIEQALIALMAGYAQRDTALDIKENDGLYSLQLRPGLGELVKNLLPDGTVPATDEASISYPMTIGINKNGHVQFSLLLK